MEFSRWMCHSPSHGRTVCGKASPNIILQSWLTSSDAVHQSHRRCLIFWTCGNLHSSVYGRPTTSYFLSAGSCSKLNAMWLLFGTNVCSCSTICKQTSVVCRPCSDNCVAGYCINVHCKKSRKLKEKMSHSLLSGGITLPAQQRRCPCCCLTMPPAVHN